MVEESISCGGVVFYKGKVLLLYKNVEDRYSGWVMPKGTMEKGESKETTALREVLEETGAKCEIIKYIDKTQYTFRSEETIVKKTVYWFLMTSNSFYCKPQKEEHFYDAKYYKEHEAYHLLKFYDEKQIVDKGFLMYREHIKNKRVTKKKLINI